MKPMVYEVRYSARAIEQLKELRAYDRSAILEKIERLLTTEPTRLSKTTIKLLKQPAPTQYRLRVNEFRVFYDVEGDVVTVMEVLSKGDSVPYLDLQP